MTKPVLTLEQVAKYRPATVEEKVWILGIRGAMDTDGVNQVGLYDDALFLITPKGVEGFNANTDPSRLLPGVAQLVCGTYYYKKGIHGLHHLDLTKPEDQRLLAQAMQTGRDVSSLTYWALRQDSDVTVMRTGDPNPHTDNSQNRFWIDIHRGGYNTTSSAGCQTIHPDQWPDFKSKAYEAMDVYNEARIPYVLSTKK
jgi:lysozyme